LDNIGSRGRETHTHPIVATTVTCSRNDG
jgi:hypothetical protein